MGDRDGVRGDWRAAATCRLVPVALLAVVLFVPLLRWSTLPKDKPGGWLLLAMVVAAIGLVIMVPQMWKPRGWAPQQWDEIPAYYIGPQGLAMGWLRSHYGPVAVGIFLLAHGAGLSVATTAASAHSRTWRVSLVGFLSSFAVALAVGAVGGLVVRRFGRLVDRDGRYV